MQTSFLIKISDNSWAINSHEPISFWFQGIFIQFSSFSVLYTSECESQSLYATFLINKFPARTDTASNPCSFQCCKWATVCSEDRGIFAWAKHCRSNNKLRLNSWINLLSGLWKKNCPSYGRGLKIWNNLKYKKSTIILLRVNKR